MADNVSWSRAFHDCFFLWFAQSIHSRVFTFGFVCLLNWMAMSSLHFMSPFVCCCWLIVARKLAWSGQITKLAWIFGHSDLLCKNKTRVESYVGIVCGGFKFIWMHKFGWRRSAAHYIRLTIATSSAKQRRWAMTTNSCIAQSNNCILLLVEVSCCVWVWGVHDSTMFVNDLPYSNAA